MRDGRRRLIGLGAFFALAVAVDVLSQPVRGLWPAAALVVVGQLFVWRTAQEVERRFTGPARHRPWLQATGHFMTAVGLLGILLSLLALLP